LPAAKCDDKTFVRLFKTVGPAELGRRTDTALRDVLARRNRLEMNLQQSINAPEATRKRQILNDHPHRAEVAVQNGIVLVASDAHYWPGEASTAHRAFVRFCKELKPKAVILNGDVLDLASISRHPPIGWEDQPTVEDEIEAAKDRLAEIESATFRTQKIWTLGTHDGRFETRLATVAPEFARIHGMHLKDHFPLWQPCWSAWINSDVVVKHRFKGGAHAPYNNTIFAGKSIVTGHLHSAKVTPFNDYNGTRYGVDTGCLADPDAKAFLDYTEDNPKNWRAGFGVLTFHKGTLLLPELVLVFDKKRVQFRGALYDV
jgi:hypothetical protein